jgi:hypothetical protein
MNYEVTLLGIENKMFKWSVNINGEFFDYNTGFGHQTKKHIPNETMKYDVSSLDKQTKYELLKSINYYKKVSIFDIEHLRHVFVNVPKSQDVLHCLFMDSEASETTFSEWCSNFGYDNDSIKAREIYDACQKNTDKLKKAFKDDYQAKKQYIQSLEL